MTFDVGENSTRVGLVEYSTLAHIEFKLDEKMNRTDLLTAVDNIAYSGGGTSTSDALELMRTQGFDGYVEDRKNSCNFAENGVCIENDMVGKTIISHHISIFSFESPCLHVKRTSISSLEIKCIFGTFTQSTLVFNQVPYRTSYLTRTL